MSVRSRSTAARTVIYDRPTSGDPDAPYNDPIAHNEAVYFCSDWGVYTVEQSGTVTINHASIAGTSRTLPSGSMSVGQTAQASHVLATHNLGYPARCFLALDGNLLMNGMQVQRASGRMRSVSSYSTNTQMVLWEWGNSTDQALPAISLTYGYLICREPTPDLDLPGFLAQAGRAVMGGGRIDTARRTMRQVTSDDDSPYWISGAPSMGVFNARWCFALADGTIIDEPGYFGPFQPPPTTRIGPF